MAQAARRGRPTTVRGEQQSEADQARDARIAARREVMRPIKVALAKMGQTQKWLVRELDSRAGISISQQAISNYVNGHTGLAENTLIWICAILEVNVQQILASDAERALLLQTTKRPLHYQHRQHRAKSEKSGAVPRQRDGSQAAS